MPCPQIPSSVFKIDDDVCQRRKERNNTLTPVSPHDVLCARDKHSYNHVGNRRFRTLIQYYFPAYDVASRQGKTKLVNDLHSSYVNESGGRFLKRGGGGEGEEEWVELSSKEVRNKIGHAFRDMKATAKTSLRSSSAWTKPKRKTLIPKLSKKTNLLLQEDATTIQTTQWVKNTKLTKL